MLQKINVTVAPPIRYQIRNYSFRRITVLLSLILVVASLFLLVFNVRYYHANYNAVNEELKQLKEVNREKHKLQQQLDQLTGELTLNIIKLERKINDLQYYNLEVASIIGEDLELNPIYNSTDFLTLKNLADYEYELFNKRNIGGNLNLNNISEEEISDFDRNINKIEEIIPVIRENIERTEESAREYVALKAATPAIWPVDDDGEGFISSSFGWRESPFSGKKEFHEGLDIGVWYGTPVLATADGIVSYAGWKGGYGWTVDIEHEFGYMTRYAHLNEIEVKEGEEVTREYVIAFSGNSGQSTGPHLHYEVLLNDEPQNPMDYIE